MAEADIPLLNPLAIREALQDSEEIALIDIREAGEYGNGHSLQALNLPWSELEVKALRLIPRRTARVVVQDADGGERARQAALRLRQLGYDNVHLAQGGLNAWRQAGYLLFQGVNVPSKAFSEWLELQAHTPSVSAERVYQWQQAGKPLLLLDGRTPAEFAQHHIPGAINCPNAELAGWLTGQDFPASLPVVVTCAGRTRGIIGAQTLIDAGVAQPVYALAGGTQAWRIAGLPMEQNGPEALPLTSADTQPLPKVFSKLETQSIPVIDDIQLNQWQADPHRTTYLFDVRSREEYLSGSLPGAIWVPGGQLIQMIDEYAGTRAARVVLFDPLGTRAQFAAWWLYQLGWSVSRYQGHRRLDIPRPAAGNLSAIFADIATLDADEARSLYTPQVQLLSADRSKNYLQQHVQGARWVNRAQLWQAVDGLSADKPVWIFAAQTELAWAVAWDLATRFGIKATVVAGEPSAWQHAGWPLSDRSSLSDDQRIDFLFWLHDRHSGNLQASRDYLAWEASLPEWTVHDGLHGFRRLTINQAAAQPGVGV